RDADAGLLRLVPIPISASNYKPSGLDEYGWAHRLDQPLDLLPRPRRNAALVEIVDKIAEAALELAVVASLESAPERARPVALAAVGQTDRMAVLDGVPAQRPNYLRRQEYLDRVKQAVLGSTQQAVGITGAPQGGRVGLHGMGGIGKTTLAIDLVNDDEVRRAF